uniref:Secreted protein n=1 Tax=Globodera pallida TaxID=36090 RepID=A0A183CI88_GLOPA
MFPIIIFVLCVFVGGTNAVDSHQEQPEPTTTAPANSTTPAGDLGTTPVNTLRDIPAKYASDTATLVDTPRGFSAKNASDTANLTEPKPDVPCKPKSAALVVPKVTQGVLEMRASLAATALAVAVALLVAS